jgi:hypothetical protein
MAFLGTPAILTGAYKILKILGGGIVKHFERKDKLKETLHVAEIKRVQSLDEHAAQIDLISVKNRGWKDEYLLLLTTSILIGAFIPYFVPHIQVGIGVLKTYPEQYWWALAAVYIDSLGFRQMARKAIEAYTIKRFK